MQTLLGVAYRQRLSVETQRLYLPSAHGDRLSLDWTEPEGADNPPTLLILHGIAGSASSPQVVSLMAWILETLGWRVAALNFRGADGRFQLPRLYHGGSSDDLRKAVEALLQLWPQPLSLVGFSLGANILLKWLGEEGDRLSPQVHAACAVGSPLDLRLCAEQLESGPVTRLYRASMVGALKRRVELLQECFPGCCDWERLRQARTFRDFDSAFTAPVHGFRDLDHYYQESSSLHWLARIRRRTMLISALDDPFLGPGVHPTLAELAAANSALKWETPRNGGHLGFLSWDSGRPSLWLENRIAAFLNDPAR